MVVTYTHDALYRLTGVNDGAGQQVGYAYDPAGNRTHLLYPDGRVVTYTYDLGNRLDTVTDWNNGQFGYDYDDANRMTGLTLPNGVESSYDYDDAGRLTLLSHSAVTETLASYAYDLDKVGNRRVLTETLLVPTSATPDGTYLEEDGLVVMEAERSTWQLGRSHQTWITQTTLAGYAASSYLAALPDTDRQYTTVYTTISPELQYTINITTTGTYYLWLRGYVPNGAGDSVYVGLDDQPATVLTGLSPRQWSWASSAMQGNPVAMEISEPGLHTLHIWQREDGFRLDRIVLTTNNGYIPVGIGPIESERSGID